MTARSSVDTLRGERERLLASVETARGDGPVTLTVEQRREWAALRVAVIDAQIREDEYLNSLLPEPLSDERRAEIVEALWQEQAEIGGRDYADMTDFAHESDYSLVQDYEQYLEAMADVTGTGE